MILIDGYRFQPPTRIEIKIYEEAAELYNNLSRENIDFINTTNIYYENYIGLIGFNSRRAPGREFDYLAINTSHRLLSNQELRRALNYAIDKESLVHNVFKNNYIVSSFPLAYGSYLYNSEDIENDHNINKARRILEDNGWSNGLEFELLVNENDIYRIYIAELIKMQLQEVGITINVRRVDDYTFERYLEYKNYEMLLTGSILPLYPDLNSFFGEGNIFNYYNEEVIDLLISINSIKDPNILKEKYGRIIEIYNEEMPFISLYFNANIIISNNSLRGNIVHNWHNILYNIHTWHIVHN